MVEPQNLSLEGRTKSRVTYLKSVWEHSTAFRIINNVYLNIVLSVNFVLDSFCWPFISVSSVPCARSILSADMPILILVCLRTQTISVLTLNRLRQIRSREIGEDKLTWNTFEMINVKKKMTFYMLSNIPHTCSCLSDICIWWGIRQNFYIHWE